MRQPYYDKRKPYQAGTMTFPQDIQDHHKQNLLQKCIYLVAQFKNKDLALWEKFSAEVKTLKAEDSWDYYHMLLVEYQKLADKPDLVEKVAKAVAPVKKIVKEIAKKVEVKKAAVVKAPAKKAPAKKTAAKKAVKKAPAKKTAAKKAVKKAPAKKVAAKKAVKKAPAKKVAAKKVVKKAPAKKTAAKKAVKKAPAKKVAKKSKKK